MLPEITNLFWRCSEEEHFTSALKMTAYIKLFFKKV